MSAFSSTAFGVTAFSPNAFDFGVLVAATITVHLHDLHNVPVVGLTGLRVKYWNQTNKFLQGAADQSWDNQSTGSGGLLSVSALSANTHADGEQGWINIQNANEDTIAEGKVTVDVA